MPKAGRSLRQQGLRRDAADDREGRRRCVLSRLRSRVASPTTWRETAASSPSTTSRSTARSSAARWRAAIAITRSTRRRRRSRRRGAHRDAADPGRTTSRSPARRYTRDADYLHYVIESWRVRDRAADRRSRAVGRQPRATPRSVARATLFKRIDPEEGLPRPVRRRPPTRRPNASAAARPRSRWWTRRAT